MPTDIPAEPYIKKDPNDLIRSGDWNAIQVRARQEIRSHTHKGGEDGTPIPREGIAPNAVDGSRINPASTVKVASVTATTALKVNDRDLLADINALITRANAFDARFTTVEGRLAGLDARANSLDAAKVNRAGDTITGALTVNGPLTVNSVTRVPSLGIGTAQANLPARLSLGTDAANTKIALFDSPSDMYGLGIGGAQFRLHVGNSSARFSFLNGAAGTEVMTITGAGRVGINDTNPRESLSISGVGSCLELGSDVADKEPSAGKIAFRKWSDALEIVGAGANKARRVKVWAEHGTEFTGAIIPKVGNASNAGIQFPTDPGGGGGDVAYIRYFVTGEGGNPEATKLLIGIDNDADDVLSFRHAGSEQMWFKSGEMQLGTSTIRKEGRLHLTNTERFYLLPKDGVFITKDWGANGNLHVAGTKNFRIDHPLDPRNKELVHSAIEGPEAAVFYRGEARLTDGVAEVVLPDYFEALVRAEDRTVLLTPRLEGREPVSALAASAVVEGRFTVKAIDRNNSSQAFYWEVKAVRADVDRLRVEEPKVPRPG